MARRPAVRIGGAGDRTGQDRTGQCATALGLEIGFGLGGSGDGLTFSTTGSLSV